MIEKETLPTGKVGWEIIIIKCTDSFWTSIKYYSSCDAVVFNLYYKIIYNVG